MLALLLPFSLQICFLICIEIATKLSELCEKTMYQYLLVNKCVVSVQLLDASATLLPADELKKRFDDAGTDSFILFFFLLLFLLKSIQLFNFLIYFLGAIIHHSY